LIIYANHPSWWDPAICIVLAKALFPGRLGFGPMDTDALDRYRFMRRIGMFGVERGTRAGAVNFLRTGTHVLADFKRMLWITGQGHFVDPRARPVRLQPGVAHLMGRVPEAVAVPLALEYPFWSEKQPEALVAFGAPVSADGRSADDLNAVLENALEATQDDLAARAMARDPAAFERLLNGQAGVGGFYGSWLAFRAKLGGRKHSADHMPDTEPPS
jgi:1-acyl-sn-glycerol-3-phosphate acyltransferase